MMKFYFSLLAVMFAAFSCKDPDQKNQKNSIVQDAKDVYKQEESTVFFPVTAFIESQVHDMKSVGLNPIKIITHHNGKQDSTWLKVETFDNEFAPFLTPVIDSVSMLPYFTEKIFLDETIGLITITYDRKLNSPDSIGLQQWSVYIYPDNNKVKRIYMVKNEGDYIQQLTWVSGDYCRIVNLSDKEGKTVIIKDITIKWKF